MSGGSYDYLYSSEIEQLRWKDSMIDQVIEDLKEFGFGQEAGELAEFVLDLKIQLNSLEERWEGFSGILRALEWFTSGDTGKEELDKAIEQRRKNGNRN